MFLIIYLILIKSELIGLLEVFKENVLKYQISEENKLKVIFNL